MPHSTAALVVIALFLAGAPAVTAAPPAVPGPAASARHRAARAALGTDPHRAPQPRTWLIGAKPGARTDGIAARHGAEKVSDRGTFVVARGAARRLRARCGPGGLYRFAEPDRPLASRQAPPGGDDVAATDWRPVIRSACGPALAREWALDGRHRRRCRHGTPRPRGRLGHPARERRRLARHGRRLAWSEGAPTASAWSERPPGRAAAVDRHDVHDGRHRSARSPRRSTPERGSST